MSEEKKQSLRLFLQKRGVPDQTIQRLEQDKIDVDVICLMSDEALKAYLPHYGDRIALISFAKAAQKRGPTNKGTSPDHKRSLVNTLRDKMNQHLTRSKKLTGNQNARKQDRRVEIGWIDYSTHKEYKQVYQRSGGGIKHVVFGIDITLGEVLEEAKLLFFRNGKSRRGNLQDYDVFITDSTYERLDEKNTVGQMYEKNKVALLRLYMATSKKLGTEECQANAIPTPSTSTSEVGRPQSDELPEIKRPKKSGVRKLLKLHPTSTAHGKKMDEDDPLETPPLQCHSVISVENPISVADNSIALHLMVPGATTTAASDEDGTHALCLAEDSSPVLSTWEDSAAVVHMSSVPGINDLASSEDTQIPVGSLVFDQPEILSNEIILPGEDSAAVMSSAPEIDEVAPSEDTQTPAGSLVFDHPGMLRNEIIHPAIITISVHRSNIQQEMVAYFMDPEILDAKLTFTYIDEKGADATGVSRDAYSGFWQEFFLSCTCGEDERVPAIFPEYGFEEWKSVGRILTKGFIDCGIFPTQLSQAFALALIHGECNIPHEVLMDSFRMYVGCSDRKVIDRALAGEVLDEDEEEDFLDLLSRVDCHTVPKGKDVSRHTVLSVAHKEIIQEPKYALDGMALTARDRLAMLLPDREAVMAMYKSKKPSCRKVLKLLECNPLNTEQNAVFGYLKDFIKGLDDAMMKKFLRYVTGADSICIEKIEVSFNKSRGLGRVPVAHTCGPVLELSCTYSSYREFRKEFFSVLDSNFLNMEIV